MSPVPHGLRRHAVLVGTALAVLAVLPGVAGTFSSTQTGDYANPVTWGGAGNPGGNTPGDSVTVNNTHTVNLAGSYDGKGDSIAIKSGGVASAGEVPEVFRDATIAIETGGRLNVGGANTYDRGGRIRVMSATGHCRFDPAGTGYVEITGTDVDDGCSFLVLLANFRDGEDSATVAAHMSANPSLTNLKAAGDAAVGFDWTAPGGTVLFTWDNFDASRLGADICGLERTDKPGTLILVR